MRMHLSRSTGLCTRATSICMVVLAAGLGSAYADMTPTTGATALVIVGATDATPPGDQQNVTNANTSSSASAGRNLTGSDGATAAASADAFADFGTLGVSGSGGASTPPVDTRAVGSGTALASAFWDDFLTAVPNPDSGLVGGAPVRATLTLDLHFQDSLLAINNGTGWFSFELFAGITTIDPVTGAMDSTTVLDDCLIVDPDPNHRNCTLGAPVVDIPANTGDQPLTIQFAPVALPIAIGQPFELGVGLSFEGECNAGPNATAISSCSFDGDALHTSITTLQPLGDFTLVAASGHDYSLAVTPPPGSVAEPGSLALVASGLVPAVISILRRRKREPGVQPPSRNAG